MIESLEQKKNYLTQCCLRHGKNFENSCNGTDARDVPSFSIKTFNFNIQIQLFFYLLT